jgi:hypothetical protein
MATGATRSTSSSKTRAAGKALYNNRPDLHQYYEKNPVSKRKNAVFLIQQIFKVSPSNQCFTMQYFSKITALHMAKNQLQERLRKLVGRYDRLLINSPQELQQHLDKHIQISNTQFPRCRPQSSSIQPITNNEIRSIVGDYLAIIDIYPVDGSLADLDNKSVPVAEQLSLL